MPFIPETSIKNPFVPFVLTNTSTRPSSPFAQTFRQNLDSLWLKRTPLSVLTDP